MIEIPLDNEGNTNAESSTSVCIPKPPNHFLSLAMTLEKNLLEWRDPDLERSAKKCINYMIQEGKRKMFVFFDAGSSKKLIGIKDFTFLFSSPSSTYTKKTKGKGSYGYINTTSVDEISPSGDILGSESIVVKEYSLKRTEEERLKQAALELKGNKSVQGIDNVVQYLGEIVTFNPSTNQIAEGAGLALPLYTQDLKNYIGDYLQLEIASEGLTRNIPAFSRFLEISGLCNGKIINMTNIASDSENKRTTIYEYLSILKDTLIAEELPSFKETKKRKPIQTNKLYLFDTGIVRALQGRGIVKVGTPEYGDFFETYLFHELRSYRDYLQNKINLSYWRSTSGFEVDFLLDDKTAIEVKAKPRITSDDLKGLKALQEEKIFKNYCLVSLEKEIREVNGITIYPIQKFLSNLWAGKWA